MGDMDWPLVRVGLTRPLRRITTAPIHQTPIFVPLIWYKTGDTNMNLNEKIEILSAARQRISKPENFLQGCLYNDEHTAFCSRGAIIEELFTRKGKYDDTMYIKELAKYPHISGYFRDAF